MGREWRVKVAGRDRRGGIGLAISEAILAMGARVGDGRPALTNLPAGERLMRWRFDGRQPFAVSGASFETRR